MDHPADLPFGTDITVWTAFWVALSFRSLALGTHDRQATLQLISAGGSRADFRSRWPLARIQRTGGVAPRRECRRGYWRPGSDHVSTSMHCGRTVKL